MRAIAGSRSENLAIGELSRRSGVNIETIRYYEHIKLLPAPPRTAGGRRIYDSTHLRRLVFIRRSRELGFSLTEINDLIRLSGPEKATCRQVLEIAERHLKDIHGKLNELKKIERVLAKAVAGCSGKYVRDCAVLEILDIQRSKKKSR